MRLLRVRCMPRVRVDILGKEPTPRSPSPSVQTGNAMGSRQLNSTWRPEHFLILTCVMQTGVMRVQINLT